MSSCLHIVRFAYMYALTGITHTINGLNVNRITFDTFDLNDQEATLNP